MVLEVRRPVKASNRYRCKSAAGDGFAVDDRHVEKSTAKVWWSCRGTAPRVQEALPARSPGSASALSWSNVRPEARLTVRCRSLISHVRRITRPCQPEFVTGWQSGSGRLSASGD